MALEDRILARVEFDPRLALYLRVQACFGLAVTVIGLPVAVLWWFVGRPLHRRQLEAMECVLTERSLKIRRGVIFKVQKSIPLDKITDLALNEGPILRWLGLCYLQVETAGGAHSATTGHAGLPAVVDAEAFRDAVLEQRDRIAAGGMSTPAPEGTAAEAAVLTELRDAVLRIERLLAERGA